MTQTLDQNNKPNEWLEQPVRRVKVRAVVEFDAFIYDYPGDYTAESHMPIGQRAASELADSIAYHVGHAWDSEPCDDVIIAVSEAGSPGAVEVESLEILESSGPCTGALVTEAVEHQAAGY